jgi:hypothetical protein
LILALGGRRVPLAAGHIRAACVPDIASRVV